MTAHAVAQGKRVSWVELYLDLVFVLAVGRLAHVIIAHPDVRHVWVSLGLFVVLWWTWIGFVVLYNRFTEDGTTQRLVFLAGTIPVGVAAVAVEPAAEKESAVFALSLAATRLVLAGAQAIGDPLGQALRRRLIRALLTSAVLFAVSALVPGPWRYILRDVRLALVGPELTPHGYVWLLAAWAVGCAALTRPDAAVWERLGER